MKMSDITTDTKESSRIMRQCIKNMYFTKLQNIKEMVNFLNGYHLPKWNQVQSVLNIVPSEIEAFIGSLPTKKKKS